MFLRYSYTCMDGRTNSQTAWRHWSPHPLGRGISWSLIFMTTSCMQSWIQASVADDLTWLYTSRHAASIMQRVKKTRLYDNSSLCLRWTADETTARQVYYTRRSPYRHAGVCECTQDARPAESSTTHCAFVIYALFTDVWSLLLYANWNKLTHAFSACRLAYNM